MKGDTMSEETEKVELSSPDLAAEMRVAFEDLFPGVIVDGVLDVGRLTELLDVPPTAVPDGRERFGLMWAGKNEAVRSLLIPSRATLLPDLDNSLDFDSAQNVFIEGDNLEVLKLLQKAYNDKVKLIYIDPPYNTGKDFVYHDDFGDGLRGYLEYTGQVDSEGFRTNAAHETSGRLHSRWLSMIYPRLVLARNLLAHDGVLLCSINDVELTNLVALLREVFGEENYLATFVWTNDGNIEQQSAIKTNHEYVVAFARDASAVAKPTTIDPNISEASKLFNSVIENTITKNGSKNPPSEVLLPAGFPAAEAQFKVAVREHSYPHVLDEIEVEDGVLAKPARLRSGWSSRRLLDLFISNGFVPIEDIEGKELSFAITVTGAIYGYKQRKVNQGHVLTVLRNMGTAKAASAQLKRDWGIVFDFPKPERLIQHLVASFSGPDDLILDFFAGSGPTAHAVALQNASDGGRRRHISVNLPEVIDATSAAGLAGFNVVSEITYRRIRAVMEAVPGNSAAGLRYLKLGTSSFRTRRSDVQSLLEIDLADSTLVSAESDLDAIATEVLLREGIPLDVPWERHKLGDHAGVVAGGVAVVTSLAITDDVVADALALNPRVIVFLEDGFAGRDAVKALAFTNAKNLGITMKTI
jgi:adenine-specific DNA-methyltransferase